ncbi:MAG: hypothetical protein AB7V32_08190 [Candidatus Berkiella sp.]
MTTGGNDNDNDDDKDKVKVKEDDIDFNFDEIMRSLDEVAQPESTNVSDDTAQMEAALDEVLNDPGFQEEQKQRQEKLRQEKVEREKAQQLDREKREQEQRKRRIEHSKQVVEGWAQRHVQKVQGSSDFTMEQVENKVDESTASPTTNLPTAPNIVQNLIKQLLDDLGMANEADLDHCLQNPKMMSTRKLPAYAKTKDSFDVYQSNQDVQNNEKIRFAKGVKYVIKDLREKLEHGNNITPEIIERHQKALGRMLKEDQPNPLKEAQQQLQNAPAQTSLIDEVSSELGLDSQPISPSYPHHKDVLKEKEVDVQAQSQVQKVSISDIRSLYNKIRAGKNDKKSNTAFALHKAQSFVKQFTTNIPLRERQIAQLQALKDAYDNAKTPSEVEHYSLRLYCAAYYMKNSILKSENNKLPSALEKVCDNIMTSLENDINFKEAVKITKERAGNNVKGVLNRIGHDALNSVANKEQQSQDMKPMKNK